MQKSSLPFLQCWGKNIAKIKFCLWMPSDLEMALGWSGQIALFLKGLLIILREKDLFTVLRNE
jgi:hypothetical protein